MTYFQLILLLSPRTTGASQVTLNLGWLVEEHVRFIPPLQVLQSILLGIYPTADKSAGCRGREKGRDNRREGGKEGRTWQVAVPRSMKVYPVLLIHIQLYLLSANHSIKCFFLAVVVALSQTNILQKLLVPRANSFFDFILNKLSVFQ